MRGTGIIRRVDDLGRIVIPKTIRYGLGIREGDVFEFYLDKNDQLVLVKYDPEKDE